MSILIIEEFLATTGADMPERVADNGSFGYSWGPVYNFRYGPDEIEIGVCATFDRWASSCDFVLRPVPRDEMGCQALFAALGEAVRRKLYNTGWGERYDIYPLVRKHRRAIKQARRQEAATQALAFA